MQKKHPLAGKRMALKKPFVDHFGSTHMFVCVEESWKNLTGKSWEQSAREGNPAANTYMNRHRHGDFADSDNVVYGKTGKFGNMFNVEELGGELM